MFGAGLQILLSAGKSLPRFSSSLRNFALPLRGFVVPSAEIQLTLIFLSIQHLKLYRLPHQSHRALNSKLIEQVLSVRFYRVEANGE